MACFHPLKGFPVGFTDTGKIDYKITEYSCQAVCRRRGSDGWSSVSEAGKSFLSYYDPVSWQVVTDFIEIPCGQCSGCRLAYSREWANRIMMELPYHENAWFLTLTYDDWHVPYSASCDLYSGLVTNSLTLKPQDLTLFWKRLRKRFPDCHISYFAAGEYGDQTWRPHYHAIVFGLDIPDLCFYKQARGNTYMVSDILNSVWSNGFVIIGEVTWQSAAYVARYCMKKAHGRNADLYRTFGLEPEFCRMSKRPAIGRQFYDDHPELCQYTKINISTPDGGRKFSPPRYFLKLIERDMPSCYEKIKAVRQEVAESVVRQIMELTDKDYLSYLETCEENFEALDKMLLRSDC